MEPDADLIEELKEKFPLTSRINKMKLFSKGYQFTGPRPPSGMNGPISGGLLYVYIHNTVTLIPTVQRNPAPLTKDNPRTLWETLTLVPKLGGGRLMEDIYSDQPCDLLIQDENGVSVWSIINFKAQTERHAS